MASAAPGGQALLAARGLLKSYRTAAGEVAVLQGVDLDVAPGEVIAIVGASGVGKSTLLHVLGTLDRPDGGTLAIAGEDVLALEDARRCAFRNRTLGFVFQFHHLLPEFTALENVMMPALIQRVSITAARKLAADILGRVGLSKRLTHRPSELSGGEQQRVAIAIALANDPAVLLADEPTGELDSATGRQIFALFRYIVSHEGITVLMATHDPVIEEYAHIVYELSDGQVKAVRSLSGG